MPAVKPTDSAERARRKRNIALGLLLGFLVVLFFVMTIVRLSGQVGAG
jgi:hypothetical protein